MKVRMLIGVLALAGTIVLAVAVYTLLLPPPEAEASDIPGAVTGGAIIASSISSFFFPIFGQCLEVSIAIHVGAAHIAKDLSDGAPGGVIGECMIPSIEEESFKTCPDWPEAVPPEVSNLLDSATVLQVDLIELTRNLIETEGSYHAALNSDDLQCATQLCNHAHDVVGAINRTANRLSDVYAEAAAIMRASPGDSPQPIENLYSFLDFMRTEGFPPEESTQLEEINSTKLERQRFLDLVSLHTNEELLDAAGMQGATEIRFSDGLQAAADAYARYNPRVLLPPPCQVPISSMLSLLALCGAIGAGGAHAIRKRGGSRG